MRYFGLALQCGVLLLSGVNVALPESWYTSCDGWVHPIKDGVICPTYVLFAPGWMQNETAAVRYCGSICLPHGISVQWPHSFCVINKQYVYPVRFSEFSCQPPSSLVGWLGWLLLKGIRVLRNTNEAIYARPASVLCPAVHHALSLPAGKADVGILRGAYQALCEQIPPGSDIVLYGFSRGATAALMFLAQHYSSCPVQRIRAVILEAPFRDVATVLVDLLPLIGYVDVELVHRVIGTFFGEVACMNALEGLSLIDASLPILFIASKKDEIVLHDQVNQLYTTYRGLHAHKSDLLYLKKSSHTRYMVTCQDDTDTYSRRVHRWYRHYGCSHLTGVMS